jgi:hypothetical protein
MVHNRENHNPHNTAINNNNNNTMMGEQSQFTLFSLRLLYVFRPGVTLFVAAATTADTDLPYYI